VPVSNLLRVILRAGLQSQDARRQEGKPAVRWRPASAWLAIRGFEVAGS